MKTSAMARLIRLLALAVAITAFAGVSQGQSVQRSTPPNLNWQWMDEVTFDLKPRQTGTESERAAAAAIWAKELAEAVQPKSGRRDPSFVLIASTMVRGATYVFSIYDRAGYGCEPPPNGSAGADHMYSRCPLRVTMLGGQGQSSSRDFAGYCALNGASSENPRATNHTEFAFDPRSSIAYFRVIQHGRVVPECVRSVRIETR